MGAVQTVKVSVQGKEKNLTILRQRTEKEEVRMFGSLLLIDLINQRLGTNGSSVSNVVADTALNVGQTWRNLPSAFTTGDGFAYKAAGANLGKEIVSASESQTVIAQVPDEYQSFSNAALIMRRATSRDILVNGDKTLFEYALANLPFSLEAMDIDALTNAVNQIVDSIREFRFNTHNFVQEQRLKLVPDYPKTNGTRHNVDEETGVPFGPKASGEGTRRTYRNKVDSVGLLVRFDTRRRGVVAFYRPSNRFGVVAEVPEGDVAKIEALLTPTATPQATKKTVIEVAGASVDELKALMDGFRQDIETLAITSKKDLLDRGRKIVDIFSESLKK